VRPSEDDVALLIPSRALAWCSFRAPRFSCIAFLGVSRFGALIEHRTFPWVASARSSDHYPVIRVFHGCQEVTAALLTNAWDTWDCFYIPGRW